jgi:hypothetical protein
MDGIKKACVKINTDLYGTDISNAYDTCQSQAQKMVTCMTAPGLKKIMQDGFCARETIRGALDAKSNPNSIKR